MNAPTRVTHSFGADYYERGIETGRSGYTNYRWMPELTLRMAHHLIIGLGIKPTDKVLDYGCAKGYLVKALRMLDIDAWGCDTSEYALSQVPADVRDYCAPHNRSEFDWVIAKDVFEHIPKPELHALLEDITGRHMFVVVPLALPGGSGSYAIPEYGNDPTHVIAQDLEWWGALFRRTGWSVTDADYRFQGIKENWRKRHVLGNGFFVLERC